MNDNLFDPDSLEEGIDVEAKKAQGKDGKGAVPVSLWESYSAFANTQGGSILLGVEERDDGFFAVGIENVNRVLEDFWATVNNSSKVSANILNDSQVSVLKLGSASVISIKVPRAQRKQRPVYINNNPLTGTYRRNHSGDYRCTDEEVKRLLAEQQYDARDSHQLERYVLDDLDMESLEAYRNRLASRTPDHPFLTLDTQGLLRGLGGWWVNRATGEEGLTLAGLLMFGTQTSIQEAVPNYFVDYREYDTADTKINWSDRLVPDGTWSGNLFDFYRSVTQRLYRDLKVPFKLEGDQRQDDTPIHKALREALVNALVHADYSERASVLVVKAPGYFGFRNPGHMRVPIADALRGGTSDCRNRSLQKMFSLIGLGEQAGSGIPRVLQHWNSQHYRPPELWEKDQPVVTLMRLRTVSLLPEEVLKTLAADFGDCFEQLDEHSRIALATAEVEGYVSNTRLQQICELHPRDITMLLQSLVQDGFLLVDGRGPATTYRLPNRTPIDRAVPEFDGELSSRSNGASSRLNRQSSRPSEVSSRPSDTSSRANEVKADEDPISEEVWAKLEAIAEPVRTVRRSDPSLSRDVIIRLCDNRFLMLNQLSELLGRESESLRKRLIGSMLQEKLLEWRFPQQPNHERQAYRATELGLQSLSNR